MLYAHKGDLFCYHRYCTASHEDGLQRQCFVSYFETKLYPLCGSLIFEAPTVLCFSFSMQKGYGIRKRKTCDWPMTKILLIAKNVLKKQNVGLELELSGNQLPCSGFYKSADISNLTNIHLYNILCSKELNQTEL